MLNLDKVVFPTNVIDLVAARYQMDNVVVKKRRLTVHDSSQSIGVFGDQWSPDKDTVEMLGSTVTGGHEATINKYSITVQGLILHSDEEVGLRQHYVLANYLRTTLAFDKPLAVALSEMESLVSETDRIAERLVRWNALDQRYYGADLGQSKWAYISVLRFNLETETRRK